MKNHLILSLLLVLAHPDIHAQGFSTSSINWNIPQGGQIYQSVNQGFFTPSDYDLSFEDNGSQGWDFIDMNGDKKPDLVVTRQMQAGSATVFGTATKFWKVYLNTGSGISTTATNWNLPQGGEIYQGVANSFPKPTDNDISFEDEGSQMWTCMDINGDQKPDLVITAQKQAGEIKVFGTTSRYWKVHLNTGSGFAPTATNWTIPQGGQLYNSVNQGYFLPFDSDVSFEDDGSQMWSMSDMNGDAKIDLVVTAQLTAGQVKVFGGGNPYWKVYLNNGSGFATTANNWTVPQGGQIYQSVNQGFFLMNDADASFEDNGSQIWSCTDMNGDNKPDLVVTAQIQNNATKVFGTGNFYWKVYVNTGTAFSTSANNWTIPAGGQIDNSVAQGFITMADFSVSGEDNNSQMWYCADLNGDNKADLAVTSQLQSGTVKVFGTSSLFWKVYLSSGSGFPTTPVNWTIPQGGQIANSVNQGFITAGDLNTSSEDNGSQMWICTDMNGDNRPDILVCGQLQSGITRVFGTGNPFWKVFLNPSTTGITHDFQTRQQFDVFPNPFSETIQIRYKPNGNFEQHRLIMYNLQGQIVHEETLQSSMEQVNPNLANGIYLYRIMDSESSTVGEGKIIKQ